MQPITITVGPIAAADADGICQSQAPAGGGVQSLTINGALASGGVATFDVPRRVSITSSGNDSTRTFVVTGTTFNGASISETITGPNATSVSSTVDFKTVTSVTISNNSVGSITVGTNTIAGSRWLRLDSWADAKTAIQCNATGTVNYTVQVTMDDPNDPVSPVAVNAVTWLNTDDLDAVTAIGDVFTNFSWTPTFARLLLNSGSGSVSGTFAQFNAVNK